MAGVFVRIIWNKVCQCFAASQWFSLCTPVSLTNKTDCHNICNWNIVESGIKHHKPNPKFVMRLTRHRSKHITSVDPVKATLLTSRWFEMAAPAVGPYPGTTLMTPGGNPAYKKNTCNIVKILFAINLWS